MTKPTTNLTREGLREAIEKLNGEDAHACYCERSTDGGCTCALKDEYIEEIIQLIDAYALANMRQSSVDSVQLYMDACEDRGRDPEWVTLHAFQDGQREALATLNGAQEVAN